MTSFPAVSRVVSRIAKRISVRRTNTAAGIPDGGSTHVPGQTNRLYARKRYPWLPGLAAVRIDPAYASLQWMRDYVLKPHLDDPEARANHDRNTRDDRPLLLIDMFRQTFRKHV